MQKQNELARDRRLAASLAHLRTAQASGRTFRLSLKGEFATPKEAARAASLAACERIMGGK